ncbi:MAG: hypothetical protein ABI857_10875, partial [Acidobacteriota bacterium]
DRTDNENKDIRHGFRHTGDRFEGRRKCSHNFRMEKRKEQLWKALRNNRFFFHGKKDLILMTGTTRLNSKSRKGRLCLLDPEKGFGRNDGDRKSNPTAALLPLMFQIMLPRGLFKYLCQGFHPGRIY